MVSVATYVKKALGTSFARDGIRPMSELVHIGSPNKLVWKIKKIWSKDRKNSSKNRNSGSKDLKNCSTDRKNSSKNRNSGSKDRKKCSKDRKNVRKDEKLFKRSKKCSKDRKNCLKIEIVVLQIEIVARSSSTDLSKFCFFMFQ
jgi:hypothetical protein